MLLSLISLPPGTPRPSELDFFLSLLHHFQSGWALKWDSFTYQEKKVWKKIVFQANTDSGKAPFISNVDLPWRHSCTWKAKSWYFCFSLGPRAYHHSPRILLTVLLSWFGCRWCTKARWRLLKIMKAFIGRRMWSFSFWKRKRHDSTLVQYKQSRVFEVSMREGYLSRTILVSIFGQCTERLSASLHWWCGEGRLWYDSRKETASRENSGTVCNICKIAPLQAIKLRRYIFSAMFYFRS